MDVFFRLIGRFIGVMDVFFRLIGRFIGVMDVFFRADRAFHLSDGRFSLFHRSDGRFFAAQQLDLLSASLPITAIT